MMKIVNGLLRFAQLLAALALIVGYIFNGMIWDLVLRFDLGISFDTFVNGYLIGIGFVLVSVPVRYVLEKIVESKFLL